ncbi:MAG: fatty acyl-AMP ligase [Chloroflexi bacterium]|nr:fatty acyl-AMP ligase [Chloroflexota bacterium]
MSTIPHRLHELVEAGPNREAIRLVALDGSQTVLTRADLLGAAGAAAAELDIRRGDLVILVQQDLHTLAATFFGVMLAGGIPSILPFATEKLHPDRYRSSMEALLTIAQPALLATDPEVADDVRGLLPDGNDLPLRVLDRTEGAAGVADPGAAAEDTALLQHSSGTTGLQKGVMLSHRQILDHVAAYGQAVDFTAEDVIVSWLPLYHDMGLIAGFLMPVLGGARLVLMSPFDWVRDPGMLLRAISEQGGTLCWLPNFAYNFLAGKVRDTDGLDLASMRAFVNCSEPVYAASHRQFAERFAEQGVTPDMLTASYAMAETVFGVTQSPVGQPARTVWVDRRSLREDDTLVPAQPGPASEELVSSGPPIPGVEVRVVDAGFNPLPDGRVGDILVRSQTMFSGYYNRPDATSGAFREGWYQTGDRGCIHEGEVIVLGRKKDLIIVGGKNVYPSDLERLVNTVEGVHPGRAVAFGVANPRSGTEDVVIVAETNTADPDERKQIAAAVRRAVAQGSDVAVRQVAVVDRDWLIKTSSGKISRSAAREKWLSGAGGS